MSDRVAKVREEIKKEVSYILQRDVKDPRLGFVSVTDVEVSRDYSFCKIYVSVLGDDTQKQQSMIGLSKATGFVRSELGKRVRMRHIPEISFVYDPSLEHGAKISAILRDIDVTGGNESE